MKLRRYAKKHLDSPLKGMTSIDVRNMSEDALLDMDYFLNDDDYAEDGFFIY